ncbi:MAG TPA: hypothetical protein VEY95_11520 [Azospirillaceae bacterium]|nr:hypothetical protein [Azospirillaceae bacterium]
MILGLLLILGAIVLVGATGPIAGFVEQAYVRRMRVDRDHRVLRLCPRFVAAFHKRIEDRRFEIEALAREIRSLDREIVRLDRTCRELPSGLRQVRVVGWFGEDTGEGIWAVTMVNRQVNISLSRGMDHSMFDAAWSRSQTVLVQAADRRTAKQRVESVFPMSMGFDVLDLAEAHPVLRDAVRAARPFFRQPASRLAA